MNIRLAYLGLCATFLSGCVTIPNIKACSVAGVMSAGMDCAQTGSDETSEMDLTETLDFLEPQPERLDPKSGEKLPERGGAICIASADYERQSASLEQACAKMGFFCKKEVQKNMSLVNGRMKKLKQRSLSKAKEVSRAPRPNRSSSDRRSVDR